METRIVRTTKRTLHALVVAGLVGAALAVVGVVHVASAPSAAACTTCDTTPPQATPDGFFTAIRGEYDEINRYSEATKVPCAEEWLDPEKNELVPVEGYLRWVEPELGQDTWRDVYDENSPGWMGRLECFVPEHPDIDGFQEVRFFGQITPENLARLAVDQALAGVPAPKVSMEPGFDSQLVNFETWIYVSGVDRESFAGPTLSVPGLTVTVQVSSGGVYLDMGDGTRFGCSGLASTGGGADCTHTYRKSSAGQPNERYQGSASIRWTATYTINGAGPYVAADAVVMQDAFAVRVAEGQAIVVENE